MLLRSNPAVKRDDVKRTVPYFYVMHKEAMWITPKKKKIYE